MQSDPGTQVNKKALIAMSGGVDSSVAAKMMRDKGFACIGCTMRLYDYETVGIDDKSCCSLKDCEDARSVAESLGMEYRIFHYEDEFKSKVMDKFARSYEEAKTPNPCVDCNKYMKFRKLYEQARAMGCDVIVTGHYARIEEEDGRFVLKKAKDLTKDQSYVLYDLTQEELSHTLFPLGTYTKEEVRKLAEENHFVNARKHDSQDICFVPNGDYAGVIRSLTGKEYPAGDFVDTKGNVLGRHKGIIHYTIGQRRGLGLSLKESLYVLRIDPANNVVVLGRDEELFSKSFDAEEVNWIAGEAPAESFFCNAKVRYRQKEHRALVTVTGAHSVHVEFDEPERAITPGQSAVFYEGETVLGGGIICPMKH
ncbi:MAG: tRNA 2-thiouridine(34) synthase MnmA [Lachnospiraceae bacterium]|nr:tRNA 2-thiouridine(34) synthase MnmA [Lachnospiraceae bacterium]